MNHDEVREMLGRYVADCELEEAAAHERTVQAREALTALGGGGSVVDAPVAERAPVEPIPPAPAERAPASTKGRTVAKDRRCAGCGAMFAPQGLAKHLAGGKCPGRQKLAAPALAAVPDPPADPPPPADTVPAGADGHFECSSCRLTFSTVEVLASHTGRVHSRVPRPAERVVIPGRAS